MFYLLLPAGGLRRLLRVYPNEVKLLLWVTLIQVVMSTSSILIGNVAQTTFLKRYGTHALPVVFMIEAMATFFFAGFVSLLMERFRTIRVFTGLLLFYGLCMGGVRVLIFMGVELAYPILYILKSQAVGILPILYWDILNDMFTTQQSKRLYTLISAGGILGTTLGSLMTRRIAIWVGTDNILLIFIAGMILAALLNELTEKVAGTPLQSRVRQGKKTAKQNNLEVLRQFVRHASQSTLLKYMVLLLAIPNMILPLLDYQFNVLVDQHFASEALTLQFFGIFRGVSNALMFVLLMFSSRLITGLGVPISLLFHPMNYCIAFGSIFFRFDIFTGVYARFTTEMLKTVLNNPARAILYNFFPERHRSMIRLVLRGSVVRAADFAGSGFLVLVAGVIEPRMLSLVALPFAFVWVVTSFRLKKAYPQILVQSLRENQKDWKQMEEEQIQSLAKDKLTVGVFEQGVKSGNPKVALLCLEFLARTRPDQWVGILLGIIDQKEPEVQKIMLDLLTPENIGPHAPRLYELAKAATLEVLPHWLESIARIDPSGCDSFMEAFLYHTDLRVKAEALAGSCVSCNLANYEEYRHRIDDWLAGDSTLVWLAAKVLAKTGDPVYSQALSNLFLKADAPDLKAWALEGLAKMNHEKVLSMAVSSSTDGSVLVRMAAMQAIFTVVQNPSFDLLMPFLKDGDFRIRAIASQRLAVQGEQIVPVLLQGLATPSRVMQQEIVRVLETIGVPTAALSRFVLEQLAQACHYLSCSLALAAYPNNPALGLLETYLLEKHQEIIEIVLRVLGIIEFGDQMRIILRAVQSNRRKDIDNAIELLESCLHPGLRRALIPLLSDVPAQERLSASCKAMGITPLVFITFEQISHWLHQDADPAAIQLCDHSALRDMPQADPDLVGKTACLQTNPLFSGLKIRELMFIAVRCRPICFRSGEAVFQENRKADKVYFLYQGALSASSRSISAKAPYAEQVLSTLFAGERQWIDDGVQLYTLKSTTSSVLLEMDGNDFCKVVQAFPLVVINLCRIYSQQLRAYHKIFPNDHVPVRPD